MTASGSCQALWISKALFFFELDKSQNTNPVMGKLSSAFVPLALLSFASLGLGRVPESHTTSPRSNNQEPCALVAAAQQKQLSQNKKGAHTVLCYCYTFPARPATCTDILIGVLGSTFFVSAELAHACLTSVPFKREDALRLIDGLDSFWHWQSTIDYLKDPPKGYLLPATDLDKGIERIRNKASGKEYENEFEFQQDMNSLVLSVHDGHFNLYLDALNVFSFRRGEIGPIVSLSLDGESLPKVYSYRMCLMILYRAKKLLMFASR